MNQQTSTVTREEEEKGFTQPFRPCTNMGWLHLQSCWRSCWQKPQGELDRVCTWDMKKSWGYLTMSFVVKKKRKIVSFEILGNDLGTGLTLRQSLWYMCLQGVMEISVVSSYYLDVSFGFFGTRGGNGFWKGKKAREKKKTWDRKSVV